MSNHQKAWVVFSGQTEIAWLRVLRPGFRHCYVLLNDGDVWTSIDPLSPYTDVVVHHCVDVDFDLPGWLKSRGYCVIPALINREHARPAPWMMFTCVEAVKRILGIHNRFIVTPWQLYRHLSKSAEQSFQTSYKQGEMTWVAS